MICHQPLGIDFLHVVFASPGLVWTRRYVAYLKSIHLEIMFG